jgi:Flp pilus assembly protein TadD
MSEALPHVRRAADLQPDNADTRHVLGVILLDLRRPAEAAGQFEAALELNPAHPGARAGLEHIQRAGLR